VLPSRAQVVVIGHEVLGAVVLAFFDRFAQFMFSTPTSIMKSEITITARLIISTFLGAFLAAGCASPRTTESSADSPAARAQIEQSLQAVFLAAERADFDRLDSYHLYGPKFTKFTSSSSERLDASVGRKGEHDGLGAARGLKMRAEALKIDLFGEVGIATFILDYSFDSGGETVRRRERSTLVFVKEAGAWKIAHEHLSRINS